jgi:ribosome-associated protein
MTDAERPPRSQDDAGTARALAIEVARAVHGARCDDVMVIDVREISQVTNYLVIATGTSDRQMRSAADDAEEVARQTGHRLFGRSADTASTWIVLDFVDVVTHIFEPNARAYYDLETLWGEGPRVEWSDGRPRPGAGGV